MARIHEQVGLLLEETLELRDAFERTVGLLRDIQNGDIDIARIVISDDGWDLPAVDIAEPTYEQVKESTRMQGMSHLG